MASSSDAVKKKVMRCKLQLSDTAESATVLKILQKLGDLDITLDILAETGIGKTVNSLRRHEQAGEFAKSLVRGWKRLVPKESTSHTEDAEASFTDKSEEQNCTNNGLTKDDLNNNCSTSFENSQNSSDEALFKTGDRKNDSEKGCEEQMRHKDQTENQEKGHDIAQKIEIQEDVMEKLVVAKEKKNDQSYKKSEDVVIKNSEDAHQKSRSDSRQASKSSCDSGRFLSEKESNKKSKPSKESSTGGTDSLPFESDEKDSKTFQRSDVGDDGSSGLSRSSEAQNRKRKKSSKEKHKQHKQECEKKGHPKHKKAKMKHKDKESDCEAPSMSFESYLNYDVNVFKKKERSGVKKALKKKTAAEDLSLKPHKPPVMSLNVSSPRRESVMELMNIPLPATLSECEKQISVDYFETKAEKESELCDVPEESAGFTGQRLNKKMQVYSGAKTVFLPAMLSLHQQCIRTLQNNINLLYETGGVPFEILEPVLERCTPEQLLRIEECNPIYVGVTDHLWGKHCQRDFKHSKLQEYESWKEMYVRLSEERERKLQRLTKSIVSAHSNKPKGRQVKMAFIHTVAKPPRDVRIQQEIHGTAVQQPHQLSVMVQDNRSRPSCVESSRSGSSSSGAGNTQDPRKKTRVAPMMAKSLKAFKKQLGRR
ncbi:elongin A, like isoform X2 [Acanthopagrus latus]|uniref:elongin A, like isoform X2 n=1 Tax=Acanthopagrus latus TaxID=8177 RepID=UPI00187BF5FA|nr:elongin A, like isoform X2 [Acanthopagrus latus]